ncbi:hypothetical protein PZH44_15410, partial [Alistipes putredinis]|nr:hypothetical protein [Alistipes putredinis]
VLSRLYDLDTPIDTTSGRRTFAALADSLIDRQRPGLYNPAIMDFGALCCLPAQPRCTECPLRDRCLAFAAFDVQVVEIAGFDSRTPLFDGTDIDRTGGKS